MSDLSEDQQEDGRMISQTGATAHCQKPFKSQRTDIDGEWSPASTAHKGHEFKREIYITIFNIQCIDVVVGQQEGRLAMSVVP